MTKFQEIVADTVIPAKTETKIISHYVANQNWLYMPKFILVRRLAHAGSYSTSPINFRIELVTPVSPTNPFVTDEFQLTTENLRREVGITLWGYKDTCNIYARCDVGCHIQVLISCMIEQTYEREPPL